MLEVRVEGFLGGDEVAGEEGREGAFGEEDEVGALG